MKKVLVLLLFCFTLLAACNNETVEADYRKMLNSLELGDHADDEIISSGTSVNLHGKIKKINEDQQTHVMKSSDSEDVQHEAFTLKESNHIHIEDAEGDIYVIVIDSIEEWTEDDNVQVTGTFEGIDRMAYPIITDAKIEKE